MSERRIEDLEVKVAFQDHAMAELDDVIRALRDEVDGLRAEVLQLRTELMASADPVVNEKPPHY